jgi:class I fructose-bisphosphate aldolase
MALSRVVSRLVGHYDGEVPGVKAQLVRLLNHGALGGTGRMIILPVDQGFEHGPDRSFAMNEPAYHPFYHFELAIEAGLTALAAPLGLLQCGADRFAGQIPLILKLNHGCSLTDFGRGPSQAQLASVKDAVRLGCAAVGFTLYPGSERFLEMLESLRVIVAQARDAGLPTVVWSYPRGGDLSKRGETALDVCAYAAHMAALAGAHIIKVKLPTASVESAEAKKSLEVRLPLMEEASCRVAHVVRACLAGTRMVVFSGGASKGADDVLNDARAIASGGGHGSIVGRNSFQRPRHEALGLLSQLVDIYRQVPSIPDVL